MWIENLTVAQLRSAKAQRRGRQRDLVERRRRVSQNRRQRLVRELPDRLRHGLRRRLRDLHQQRDRRLLGKHLRLGLQRLGHVHRRLPGMQGAGQRSDDGKQRARLLRLERRRQADDRKLASSSTTRPASLPNSENPGDGPPPQDGQCHRQNVEDPNPTPHIASTRIKRCTIIRDNMISENNNLTVPANTSAAAAPWGTGVELPGDYARPDRRQRNRGQPDRRRARVRVPQPVPARSGHDLLPARPGTGRQTTCSSPTATRGRGDRSRAT